MSDKSSISRREFLQVLLLGGFSSMFGRNLLSLTDFETIETEFDLAVARGDSATPTALVQAAIAALGGMEAFVKPGDDVIIKPNIVAADYSYQYAAYTNPEVVAAVTALCIGAGAERVRVMDRPSSSTCEQVYARSGIGDAVTTAGGQMEVMSDIKYRKVDIPDGLDISNWSVYGDVLDTDVFINVPIAKHHRLSKLTLSMKNLMGVITQRNQFHPNLGQRIADLASLIRPTLTIMDAVNILMDRGPRGGNLSDVKQMNTIIASQDFVATGAYAATFFDKTGADIDALRLGAEMGLGTIDLDSLNIEEIAV
ncbi:MAG: DUF362 domain-containing protein [Anaerolineales bacterium]|nr:DUF362 domain-containing protein [Anaerolineales bacterium]